MDSIDPNDPYAVTELVGLASDAAWDGLKARCRQWAADPVVAAMMMADLAHLAAAALNDAVRASGHDVHNALATMNRAISAAVAAGEPIAEQITQGIIAEGLERGLLLSARRDEEG